MSGTIATNIGGMLGFGGHIGLATYFQEEKLAFNMTLYNASMGN